MHFIFLCDFDYFYADFETWTETFGTAELKIHLTQLKTKRITIFQNSITTCPLESLFI